MNDNQRTLNYELVNSAINSITPSEDDVYLLKDKIEGIAEYIKNNWKSLLLKVGITTSVFLGAWYFLNKSKSKIIGKMGNYFNVISEKAMIHFKEYLNLNKSFSSLNDEQLQKVKHAILNSSDIFSFRRNLFNLLSTDKKDKNLHKFLNSLNDSLKLKEFDIAFFKKYINDVSMDKSEILKLNEILQKKEKYLKITKIITFIFIFMVATSVFILLLSKKKNLSTLIPEVKEPNFSMPSFSLEELNKENVIYESSFLKKIKVQPILQFILKKRPKILEKIAILPLWLVSILSIGFSFLVSLFILYKKYKSTVDIKSTSFFEFIYLLWKKNALKWTGIFLVGFITCFATAYFLFGKRG